MKANKSHFLHKVVAAAANFTIRPEDAEGESVWRCLNFAKNSLSLSNFVKYFNIEESAVDSRIPCAVGSQRSTWFVSWIGQVDAWDDKLWMWNQRLRDLLFENLKAAAVAWSLFFSLRESWESLYGEERLKQLLNGWIEAMVQYSKG